MSQSNQNVHEQKSVELLVFKMFKQLLLLEQMRLVLFFPPSPRHVTVEQAQELAKVIPPYVQMIGLFVNASATEIQDVLDCVPLDVLQLHGDETPEQCQEIARHCKRRWYKAIQVKPDLDVVAEIQKYQAAGASAVLLDAWHPELKGGQDISLTGLNSQNLIFH